MSLNYLLIAALLTVTVFTVLWNLRHNALGAGVAGGFVCGLAYFLVLPMVLFALTGYYRAPSRLYGARLGPWATITVLDPGLLRPFSILAIGVALCAVTVGLVSRLSRVDIRHFRVHRRTELQSIMLLALGTGLVDWSMRIWTAGGIARYLAIPFADRTINYLGGWSFLNNALEHASVANNAVICACAAAYYLSDRPRWRWMLVAAGALALQLIMTENRIFLASFLVALAYGSVRLSRYRTLLALLLILPGIAVLNGAFGLLRGTHQSLAVSLTSYLNQPQSRSGPLYSAAMDATESADLLSALQIIREFGVSKQYLHGATLFRVLELMVPRSYDSSKTESFSTTAARLLEPRMEGSSMPTTIIAEFYANFGIGGFLMLPLLAATLVRIGHFQLAHAGTNNSAVSSLSFVMGYWLVRSAFADALGFALMAGLILLGYGALSKGDGQATDKLLMGKVAS